MRIPDTKRMPMCFSGCPLGIVNEPFQASSKMDGVTLESFITWSTPSHHIPCLHPGTTTLMNILFKSATTHQHSSHAHSWHQTNANVLLRVSPWYCHRAISDLIENGWRDTWVLHHMKHTFTSHTTLPPSRTTRFSKVQQRINIHHFRIPDTKRIPMCFSGCPLGIVIEPFQASSKMDGVTLESFITWSAPSHHIPYLHPIRRPLWTCCSKVQQRINIHHMRIPDTKRMPMCFSGCPLGIVNEPFQASSKMDGVTLESFITWSAPSHHIPCLHPIRRPSWTCCSKVQQRINIHHMRIPDSKRMPMCFSGCPLGIVNEPFQASSKMDGVTLESFITWSTPSHHIRCFYPAEPPSLNMFVRSATTYQHSSDAHSWHQTNANVLLRVSPWYCQRAISDLIENGWRDTWVLHHMKHTFTSHTMLLPGRTTLSEHVCQKCNNASTFITCAFLTRNRCQCASQGVPLVLSTSHFRPHRKWMAVKKHTFLHIICHALSPGRANMLFGSMTTYENLSHVHSLC